MRTKCRVPPFTYWLCSFAVLFLDRRVSKEGGIVEAVKKTVHFDSSSKCKFASTLFGGKGKNAYEKFSYRPRSFLVRLLFSQCFGQLLSTLCI